MTTSATLQTSELDSPKFNAQLCAHRILRLVSRPTDPTIFRGVRSPNRRAAHLHLTFEADALGLPLTNTRVSLVRRWIDMSSGVRI